MSRLRVLLVDGEPLDRLAIRRAVQGARLEVELLERETLAAGLGALDEDPDCVLVDLNLPDGSGMALVEAAGSIPVILLAGQADLEAAQSALLEGAQDYLIKDVLDANMLDRSIRYAVERKRGERLQQELAHSDRLASLGRLAASVAHEINNPSAYVAANLTILLEIFSGWKTLLHALERAAEHSSDVRLLLKEHAPPSRPEETMDMLRDSLGGLERISTIVRQLRSFARRPEEDEPTEPVSLTEIASWACVLTQVQVSHRARFEKDLDPDLPSFIGRPGRLAQVATNLLVNAAHAIPEGDPESHLVRVSTYAEEDLTVVLCVEDTGPGMSEVVKRRAMEPFFTTKPHGEGTGLGLAIVADIVRSHHGTIAFEDREGGGTRVLVSMPRDTGLRETAPPASSGTREAIGTLRILLIDDEPSIRRAYRRLLSPHEVIAFDADDALNHTLVGGDQRFDVVVCDLMMPGIDGVAIYKRFLEDSPYLASRTIFCTGGAFGERARQFVARTGRPVLEKPVSKDALVDAARAMVERERKRELA